MFYAVSGGYTSLRKIATEANSEHSISLSKQGLDDRFSSKSVSFSKKLLEEAIHNQVMDPVSYDATQLFNRVLIKDSTRFDLHESLQENFPSFGGDASKAGASIQFEFDLKKGEITDLDLQSGLDRDSKDAIKKKDEIQSGDLIIRDLGYYSIEVIQSICSKNAFFISRLYHSANVYESKQGKSKIDFNAIYNQMHATKITHMELDVFVGKEKTSMRLVICLLPEETLPADLNWDLWLGSLPGNIHFNKELNPPISLDPPKDEEIWGGWRWYKEMRSGLACGCLRMPFSMLRSTSAGVALDAPMPCRAARPAR